MPMVRYKALAITTRYWKPGSNHVEEILHGVRAKISDQDFVAVSEKAISTALKNIVDEDTVEPSLAAELVAKYWMPIVWGHILGRLCHFGERLLGYLRRYPSDVGGRHKHVALQHGGWLNALMFGSEGGIDGTNLPFSYVSLPLSCADEIAQEIRSKIEQRLGEKVSVIIVDTDKTYSFRNFHFTPRHGAINGIHSFGGFIAYVVGRFFKLKKRPTPLAVAGCRVSVEEALTVADIAGRVMGFGAGKTVWDMAERFTVGLADVSWEMLETVTHKPIAIVRKRRRRKTC